MDDLEELECLHEGRRSALGNALTPRSRFLEFGLPCRAGLSRLRGCRLRVTADQLRYSPQALSRCEEELASDLAVRAARLGPFEVPSRLGSDAAEPVAQEPPPVGHVDGQAVQPARHAGLLK